MAKKSSPKAPRGSGKKSSLRKLSPKAKRRKAFAQDVENDVQAVMEQILLKKLELDGLLGVLGKLI